MGAAWEAGRVIADRYRLSEIIGRGGMGEVWKAEHLKLKSPVAIKVLRRSMEEDRDSVTRFLREARAAAKLRSTNVVQVFDYGVEDDSAYIAMEFLEGESLRDRLRAQGPLSSVETARLLTQVSRAVARAHKNGIVHRDLKPGNIHLVPEEGEEIVKVLDFGIAKILEEPTEATEEMERTNTGAMLGTPYYMSPEQLRGKGSIDTRADIWALGVIAYQCLLGERPFLGETVGDLVVRICAEDPPIPSECGEVPDGFDAWFARSTKVDPEERFGTVGEQLRQLREVLLDESAAESRRASEGFDASASASRSKSVESSGPISETNTSHAKTLGSGRPSRQGEEASRKSPARWVGIGLIAVVAVVGVVAMSSQGEESSVGEPAEAHPAGEVSPTPASSHGSAPGAPTSSGVDDTPSMASALASASAVASAVARPPVVPKAAPKRPTKAALPGPKTGAATSPPPREIDVGF